MSLAANLDFVISAITFILIAIICLPFINNYRRMKRISNYIDGLPGDKRYPVVGTALPVLLGTREQFWATLRDRHAKYGPIFRSWMGPMPNVHIYKPEHAQVLFKSNTNVNKGVFYKFFKSWLGEGLISGNLPKWKHHRKVITPAFHFKVLDSYGEIFAEKGDCFAKYLDRFAGKGYFEVTQYLMRLAVDVISETAMGVHLNYVENGESQYADAIVNYLKAAFRRMYNPAIYNNFLFSLTNMGKESKKCLDYIRKFNQEIIDKRKEYFTRNKNQKQQQEDEFGRKEKLSFLDILLAHQENNNLDDEDIQEEVNTFMFAGQDTTASTICWAFLALGNHPEILKKVQLELDTIFEGDPDRKVTSQDVAQMEYLDMVIREVLRCYCFVPYISRELLEDLTIDGVYIPKGVNLTISLHDLHHDPDHWPDPYKFDPDRFLPENVANRHPFAFVPFSAGPRNCLGQKFGMQNIKTLLAYILRRHSIKCLEQPKDINYYVEVVLRPQKGLHVSLELRNKH